MKTEPGEPCDNKPNLRRRMGSVVVKNEMGKDDDLCKELAWVPHV